MQNYVPLCVPTNDSYEAQEGSTDAQKPIVSVFVTIHWAPTKNCPHAVQSHQ